MLQLYPVYSLCNRRKTLTGSPDPKHANGTNKPCSRECVGSRLDHMEGSNWWYRSGVMCNMMSGSKQLDE